MRRFRRDVRLVHRLVREHRLADDVADREDVRHVGAHLLVDVDEAAIGDGDAGLVGADLLAVRAAADGDQHEVVELRPAGAFSPSKLTSMPAGVAFAPTVLVFSITLSKRCAFIFSHTLTRSRSAPAIRPSSISTTSMRVPSVEYTVAISRPMMPPPTTSMRFGMLLSSSAPVESTTRGSSGMNGSFIAWLPAAMIALSNLTTFFAAAGAASTST